MSPRVDDLPRERGRALVMGVLNVTPDSFATEPLVSADRVDVEEAVARGRRMWDLGADLVDIGGESTRPNARRVDEEVEAARVLPVVRGLVQQGIAVSVDTMRASIAEAAVDAGAVVVNDVSGGLADQAMLPTVARLGVVYVAMHWRRHSDDMYAAAEYDDVAADVARELAERVEACLEAGIARDRLVLDPGIGFSKTPAHNWAVLRGLAPLEALGLPLLVGVSRKRFLGDLLAGPDGPREVTGRDAATAAVSAILAHRGTWGFRVHDVEGTLDAVRVAAAMGGRTWTQD